MAVECLEADIRIHGGHIERLGQDPHPAHREVWFNGASVIVY